MSRQILDVEFTKYFFAKSIGVLNPQSPVVVHQDTQAKDAIALLNSRKIGCLLVTDEAGKLVGIFTERDALRKMASSDCDSSAPIHEYMTPNPGTEDVTSSLAQAMVLMSTGKFRHLPLVDKAGHPIGVISVRDILNHFTVCIEEYYDNVQKEMPHVASREIEISKYHR